MSNIFLIFLTSILFIFEVFPYCIKSYIPNISTSLPINIIRYTRKNPLRCKLEQVKMIGRYDDSCEFYHITLSHIDQFSYNEGQYCTIIPPNDTITDKRHAPRPYSISNSADNCDNIIELCIRKFINPETNSPGLCSNYLINSKIGDIINLAGPFGRLNIRQCLQYNNNSTEMLHNSVNNPPNIILVATGTGIAPFRAFYKYLFKNTQNLKLFNKLLLVYGVRNEECLLYKDELNNLMDKFPEKIIILKAFSRVFDRKYVQNVIIDNGDLVKSLIDNNSNIFICGGKAIELPVKQALKDVVNPDVYNQIEERINVEVY